MVARLVLKEKSTAPDGERWEWVIWEVPVSERYPQGIRYRMVYIPKGHKRPAVLFDNHHPKGHHQHIDAEQSAYNFRGIAQLREDFKNAAIAWKEAHEV